MLDGHIPTLQKNGMLPIGYGMLPLGYGMLPVTTII
jgi:hypothetical protein